MRHLHKRLVRGYALAALLASGVSGPVLADDCASLEAAAWLLGEWTSGKGTSETWHRAGPRTFEGAGTSGADTETLRLVEMSGQVFYIAKVAHNVLPVAFALVECGDDALVFENPAHGFPRRLEYRRTAAAAMTVTVGDGATRSFEIHFKRAGP